MITMDVQALTAYFLSGATFSAETRRAMANAAVADIRGPAVLAPWQLPPTEPMSAADKLLRILGTANAFNLKDLSLNRPGVDDNFRKLFTLHIGLGLMADLADLAAADRLVGTSRGVLQRKFEKLMVQLNEFLADNDIDGVSIVKGLKRESIQTAGIVPPTLPDRRIEGGIIADTRDQIIPGITNQKFFIDITAGGIPNTVTVDFALMSGTKTLDNISAYINDQIEAAGLNSRVETNRFSEFEYGLLVVQNGGEIISFKPDPTTQKAAAYVVGDTGFDTFADAFVRKFDGLNTADPGEVFFREFGAEDAPDVAQGVAVDSEGNVYVVGTTEGNLNGQNNPNGQDIFLTKYDSAGTELFTRLLGSTTGTARAFDVAIDSKDNVIIAGTVIGELSIDSFGGGVDGFVVKFDKFGQELFVRQQSPPGPDATVAIAIDADDNIFVGGYVEKVVGTGLDNQLITLDPQGNAIDIRPFGNSSEARIIDMATAPDGNVVILSDVGGTIRLTKFSGNTFVFVEDLGNVGEGGSITGLAVDDTGIYVTGSTTGGSFNGTVIGAPPSGGLDAFVAKAGPDGKAQRYAYLGSDGTDRGTGIAVNNGEVFITGSTDGVLPGGQKFGSLDGFMAKFDTDLASNFVEQFRGSFGFGAGTGIAIDPTGGSVLSLLGIPTGVLPATSALSVTANTTVRPNQQFSISINGGRPKRITIGIDDSFRALSLKVNILLGAKGRAKLVTSGDVRAFQIEARNGATIELLAGPDGRNALPGLGLEPMTLFGKPALGQEDSPSDSAFALGLIGEFSLLKKSSADDASVLLRSAQMSVKKAFEFLTGTGPEAIKKIGAPSAYMLSRISNMKEALRRLSAGQSSFSTFA